MFAQLPLPVQILIVVAVFVLGFIGIVLSFVLPLITIWRGGKVKLDIKNKDIEIDGDPDDAPVEK